MAPGVRHLGSEKKSSNGDCAAHATFFSSSKEWSSSWGAPRDPATMKSGNLSRPMSLRRTSPPRPVTQPLNAFTASVELAMYPTWMLRPSRPSGSDAGKCGERVIRTMLMQEKAAMRVQAAQKTMGSDARKNHAIVLSLYTGLPCSSTPTRVERCEGAAG